MTEARYSAISIEDIPEPEYEKGENEADWRPVRIHFGIQSFGTNGYVAGAADQQIVGEHSETDTQHEELYYVARGHAIFTVGGEDVDAPVGTFVYVPDPNVMRSAVAHDAGTIVLCFGGTPGEAFEVSLWERKYDQAHAGS
jgi:quercetin dioxygenase-like cupin family protein